MEDSEEEDQYQDYDDQWSQDGSSQTYSDEDTGYGSPPWPGDGYASSEPEDDLEEEPLDLEPQDDDRDNMSQGSWSVEEEEEGEMKRLMYKEFVDYARRNGSYHRSVSAIVEPRRWIFATLPPRSPTPRKEETKVKPIVPLKGERLVPKARTEQSRSRHRKEKPLAPAKVATPSSNALRTPQAAPHQEDMTVLLRAIQALGDRLDRFERQPPPHQGKCSNSKKLTKPTCYRCHKRGHFAVNCSSKEFIKETSLGDKMKSPKASDDIVPYDLSPNSRIMHLSFVKGVENHAGTQEEQHEPPDGMKCGKETFTKEATLSLKEVSNKTWQGVIASTLIKEEPPDAHISSQKNFCQGKLLDPFLTQDTNLLYLGAGKIVSRSKPFQEGEYDEVIKSSYTKEPSINIPGKENMNRKDTNETYKRNSVQTEVKIKEQSSVNLCRVHSTTLEFNTKKNQPKRSSYEDASEDTIRPIYKGPDEDMRSLKETFQTNHKEPGYKPTSYGNYIQPGIFYNWNHIKSRSGVKVIQLLNRIILHLPYLESPGFRHLQNQLWRPGDTLTLSRDTPRSSGKSSISVPCTSISGLCHHYSAVPAIPDVVTTNRPFQHFRTMSPPSSRSSTSGPCHHSRPRPAFLDCDTTAQPFQQFRTLSPPSSRSSISGTCHHYPATLNLGAFTHQWLFLSCCCVLKTHPLNLDTPRHHLFPPKLSRLKPLRHCLSIVGQ